MPVVEAYARKFGGPERAAAIIDKITAVAAEDGIEFHLDRALRANTLDAHRLLWFAARHGRCTRRRSRSGCWRRTSPTGSTSATTEVLADCAADVGHRRATPCSRFLDSDDGRAEVARRARRAPPSSASPPCRRTCSTATWAVPGAQDPDTFASRPAPPRRRRAGRLSRLAGEPCADGAWRCLTGTAVDPDRAARSATASASAFCHGFTQTSASWTPLATEVAGWATSVVVDLPVTAVADVRADLRLRPAARRRRVGSTSATASAAGCACTSPLAYPDRGRAAGADRRHPGHRRRRPSARGASDDDERSPTRSMRDRRRRVPRAVAEPAAVRRPPADPADLADRRRNTADGLAGSLRLAGTGTQEPLWDRLRRARRMPMLVMAGARRHQVRRHRPSGWRATDRPTPSSPRSPTPATPPTSSNPTRPPCCATGCGSRGREPDSKRAVVRLVSRRGPGRCAASSAETSCTRPVPPSTAIRSRPVGAAAHGARPAARRRRRRARPISAAGRWIAGDHDEHERGGEERRRTASRVAGVAEAHGQRPLAGDAVGRDVAQVVDDQQGARQAPGDAPGHPRPAPVIRSTTTYVVPSGGDEAEERRTRTARRARGSRTASGPPV